MVLGAKPWQPIGGATEELPVLGGIKDPKFAKPKGCIASLACSTAVWLSLSAFAFVALLPYLLHQMHARQKAMPRTHLLYSEVGNITSISQLGDNNSDVGNISSISQLGDNNSDVGHISNISQLGDNSTTQFGMSPIGTPIGGTCLVAIAVGDSYVDVAKIAGRTKVAYAMKHAYRNLFYYFNDPQEFNDWCRGTQLGSQFTWEDDTWEHSTLLKYCALSAAINENGCEKALFTDADAMIVNFNRSIDFDWPGTPNKPEEPHALWAFAQWPEGFDDDWRPNVQVVPHDDDWCLSNPPGSCGSYGKFATCLNTGAFIVDNSQSSRDFIINAIKTLLEVTQDHCTTGYLNPWSLDQCKLSHGDQCIVGCTIKHEPENDGKDGDEVIMPDDFMCLDTSSRPRLQEVYQLKNDYPKPHNDTFIVNCIGDSKTECITAVFNMFPHLAAFAY